MRYLLVFFIAVFSSASYAALDIEQSDCNIVANLIDRNYIGVYKGQCVDGLAHGQGVLTLTWDEKGGKVDILKGNFNSGLFMGTVSYTKKLIIDDRTVITKLDVIDGNDIWLRTLIQSNRPLAFCSSRNAQPSINIAIKDKMVYADDEKAKSLLNSAFESYYQYCKKMDKRRVPFWVGLQEGKDVALLYPQSTEINAEMRYGKKGFFHSYTNRVKQQLAEQKKDNSKQLADKKKAEEIQKVKENTLALLKQHDTAGVLQASTLHKDPFSYEGRVVAVIAGLGSMTTRESANIYGMDSSWGGSTIHVKNIKPSYFDDNKFLLLGRVVGREKIEGENLVVLEYVDHYTCQQTDCRELYKAKIDKYAE